MRLRTIACAVTTAMLLALSMVSAAATTAPTRVAEAGAAADRPAAEVLRGAERIAAEVRKTGPGFSTESTACSCSPCLSFAPGDRNAQLQGERSIGPRRLSAGSVITEDDRFPESSYPLNGPPPASRLPFTRENLEPICDDIIAQGFLGDPMPATLDGDRSITGPVLNSGVFTARVNRHAQMPGGADLYADSVALGHPGRLATVFCGFKAKVQLRPGAHTIVVDYSGLFGGDSTVFTYNITVKG